MWCRQPKYKRGIQKMVKQHDAIAKATRTTIHLCTKVRSRRSNSTGLRRIRPLRSLPKSPTVDQTNRRQQGRAAPQKGAKTVHEMCVYLGRRTGISLPRPYSRNVNIQMVEHYDTKISRLPTLRYNKLCRNPSCMASLNHTHTGRIAYKKTRGRHKPTRARRTPQAFPPALLQGRRGMGGGAERPAQPAPPMPTIANCKT